MPLEGDKKKMDELVAEFNKNFEEFMTGKKVAAGRARKALMEMSKLGKVMRGEIQERKGKM